MRPSLILPPVEPEVFPEALGCLNAGCGGCHVQHWPAALNPLRDTRLAAFVAHHYLYLTCARRTHLPRLAARGGPRPDKRAAQGRVGMSSGAATAVGPWAGR